MKFQGLSWKFMKFHARSPAGTLNTLAKPMVLGGAGEQVAPGPKGVEFRVFLRNFMKFHGNSWKFMDVHETS